MFTNIGTALKEKFLVKDFPNSKKDSNSNYMLIMSLKKLKI